MANPGYVTGKIPSKSSRGGRRWNSKLPKGNQHTTPEKEEERQAAREKRESAEEAFVSARKALSEVLAEDQYSIRQVWKTMVTLATEGHYKAGELVLGYAFGKPIATQENVNIELTGDEVADAAERVRDQLGEGWQVVPSDE